MCFDRVEVLQEQQGSTNYLHGCISEILLVGSPIIGIMTLSDVISD